VQLVYTLVSQRAQTEGICGGNQGVSQCDGGGVFWGESWGCIYVGVSFQGCHSGCKGEAVEQDVSLGERRWSLSE